MNDPHVKSLSYRFVSENQNDRFKKDSKVETTIGEFKVTLRDDILIVEPLDHYDNEISAKKAFEPYLQNWEANLLLSKNRYRIKFDFIQSEIIDRKPDPQVTIIRARTAGMVMTSGTVTLQRVSEYPIPDPEISFRSSELTDQIIFRYKRYLDGRELLTTLGNWVETRLRTEYGDRKNVAKTLKIHEDILQNLGRLCDTQDPTLGRKAKGWGPKILTSEHQKWMEETICVLIMRVGAINAGLKSLPKLEMKDLPKLSL